MPFKKFQDQEGLASISRALASRKPQVLEGENHEMDRCEKNLEITEDSTKKRRRKVEERPAEADQPPSKSALSPKQSPAPSLSKASAGGENAQKESSILEHRMNSMTRKKQRVQGKNAGGHSGKAVPAEHDEHLEDHRTSKELTTSAVQNLEHPSQSSQIDAKQKSFRELYVQSFTSAFSTDLYNLQQWALEDSQPVTSMILRMAGLHA
ncbi:hypothetical protein COCOBI_04-5930 [Coccomyxa sp. Obi]|nr:hypothetical protein COCOBI_04-5930 [Coccomyxa sp. Obi]